MPSVAREISNDCFGAIIRQARNNRGITQGGLAELIEVEDRTVQRWETEESIPWPICQEKLIAVMPEIAISFRDAIKKLGL
jgi:ribosome-binding protein aMBF1 (putative translation factor)